MRKMPYMRKWQAIFALTLTLLMLAGCMGGGDQPRQPAAVTEPAADVTAEPEETVPEVEAIPIVGEAGPPESPDPARENGSAAAPMGAVERIDILYLDWPWRENNRSGRRLGDNIDEQGAESPTMFVGERAIHLIAAAYPLDAAGEIEFEWACSDEEAIKLTPTEDGGCDVECIGTHPGGVVVTVRAGGAEGRCRFYTHEP